MSPLLHLGLRSSLTTGLGAYRSTSAPGPSPPPAHTHPPTSAMGLSRSLAHLCTAKESIPGPHLHRNRIHPPPTSVPPLLSSGTSASAQHNCDTSPQHTVLQPHPLCCNRVPPVNDPAEDGTGCALLRCRATGCIRSNPSKRGEGAADRTAWRVRGTVDEDWRRRKRGHAV
jgi:hypothetical protein